MSQETRVTYHNLLEFSDDRQNIHRSIALHGSHTASDTSDRSHNASDGREDAVEQGDRRRHGGPDEGERNEEVGEEHGGGSWGCGKE